MGLPSLPRDWRVVVPIVGATLAGYFAVRTWVVGVAQASVNDAPAMQEVRRKVDGLFLACVARGECKPPEVQP